MLGKKVALRGSIRRFAAPRRGSAVEPLPTKVDFSRDRHGLWEALHIAVLQFNVDQIVRAPNPINPRLLFDKKMAQSGEVVGPRSLLCGSRSSRDLGFLGLGCNCLGLGDAPNLSGLRKPFLVGKLRMPTRVAIRSSLNLTSFFWSCI